MSSKMQKVFLNDVGTKIVFDTGTDVSTLTEAKIKAKSPSGLFQEWTAAIGATPTSVTYITQNGNFNELGTWKLQVFIRLPGWTGHGSVAEVKVENVLAM